MGKLLLLKSTVYIELLMKPQDRTELRLLSAKITGMYHHNMLSSVGGGNLSVGLRGASDLLCTWFSVLNN